MDDWISRFTELSALEAQVRGELVARSRVVRLPAGARAFSPGQKPQNLLLLLDGTVRVQQVAEGGREIVLYRVTGGESCIMTVSCLMANDAYSAEGIAETDVVAVAIPQAAFDDAMARSAQFRAFVFTSYSTRLAELLGVINEVAFARLDVRLAKKILELAGTGMELSVTHAQMAVELGTAREVVSRQLAELQRRGVIRTDRGQIVILDRAALERIAQAA